MKIRPVGAALFHADGRTDMSKLIVVFRNFANAPNNDKTLQRKQKKKKKVSNKNNTIKYKKQYSTVHICFLLSLPFYVLSDNGCSERIRGDCRLFLWIAIMTRSGGLFLLFIGQTQQFLQIVDSRLPNCTASYLRKPKSQHSSPRGPKISHVIIGTSVVNGGCIVKHNCDSCV